MSTKVLIKLEVQRRVCVYVHVHLSSSLHHHSACIINGYDYCNQKFLFIWRSWSGQGAFLSTQKKPLVSSLNFSEIAMPQCTLFPMFGDKLVRHT